MKCTKRAIYTSSKGLTRNRMKHAMCPFAFSFFIVYIFTISQEDMMDSDE